MPDIAPDHSQSLARIHRSKSRQKALELRNSVKTGKTCSLAENNVGYCTSRFRGSGVTSLQFDHVDQSESLKLAEASNKSCVGEEVKAGECMVKENSSDVYHGRSTRSRSSRQKASSVNESGNVCTSTCFAKEDDPRESISKQQLDHVDQSESLKLVEASTKSCVGEEVKAGECMVKENSSDVYHGRRTRSRSSRQKASSVNESGNLCTSTCFAREDDPRESISKQQLDHVDQSESLKLVEASNKSCVGEEVKAGECMVKENSSDVYHGRSTRPRSSRQKASSVNESGNVCTSTCFAKEDDPRESISKQQPNQVDLAELVSAVGHAISEAQMENEGNHRGNEMASIMYSGGVPRCTSSSPQPNSTKQPLDMNDSPYIDNRDSRIRESIGDPSLEPNCVKEISELAKPSYVISNDSYGRVKANVSDYWSKEKGSGLYSGRITRSRGSSQQADVANESLKLDGSCGNAEKEPRQLSNPVDDFRELVKPFNITDKSCGVNEKMLNYQNNEERADSYYGKISRNSNQQLGVYGLPILDTSSNTAKDNDGSLSQSFGRSSQPHQPLNQVREEGVDLQEVLDTQTNALPCIERRDIDDLGICDTVVAETDIDSDGIVEACSVTSRSNSDGSIRGMELSVSRPAIDSLMLVKPKQLDFDDLEDCSLNEIAGPASENKQQSLSSERRTSTLLHSTLILDKVNYQEKPILSVEMPLLEDQAVFSKEDKPWNDSSEAFVNETALFVDENNNSVHKKINSGDCYVMGSWPQHKRRKIVGQLTSSSYASSSLMRKMFQPNVTDHVNGNMNTIEDPDTVQISEGFYMSHMGDDMQPYAIKSSVEDIHQTSGPHMVWPEFSSSKLQVEEIKPGLEGRSGSANKCGARSPSGLAIPSTGVSQGSSLEKVPRDNHTIVIFDETSQHTAEKNQVSLQLEDRFELGSSELLTCTETAMKEKRFHLERNGKSLSNSVSSPHSQSGDLIGTDQNMPVYEWFGMETEGIDFEKLDLSDSALESAIAVERLCKSVCLETPLSHFASAYNKHKTLNLYQSVPNGLLEVMELSTTVNTNSNTGKELEASSKCFNDKVNDTLHGRLYSDSPAFTNAPSTWDIRKPLMSPVGKLWEGITSRSGSSEKRVSSIPDLPCISEENENTIEVPETFKDVVGSEQMISSVKRGLLADIANNSDPPISVYDSEIVSDRYSLASVSTEYSFTGTCRRDNLKHGNQKGNRRKCNSKVKENRNLVSVNGVKRARESNQNRLSKPILSGKTSLRKGGLSLAETRSKHNNIVSNITSFIPLVQQKQAAAVVTGKRDVKVKALEAAEVAKRLAEKKENERKIRKEALKLERAKMEEQNLRQWELEKEKKDQEHKRKEADMAAKKRQREDEEKKERERKRKRVEEARRQQQLVHEEKLRTEKEEKERKHRAADERAFENKKPKDKSGKHVKMGKEKGDTNLQKVPETKPVTSRVSTIDDGKFELGDCGDNSKEMTVIFKAAGNDSLKEQAYEISPYKGSDDEDEDDEDDDKENNKFIPSWASKNHLALIAYSQQSIDPRNHFRPRKLS
ncbi:hypothetical protein OIU76_019525 [Salix suchowensis]|nr:hypothetical protein OIU76_019525 [Salix suchowensis]